MSDWPALTERELLDFSARETLRRMSPRAREVLVLLAQDGGPVQVSFDERLAACRAWRLLAPPMGWAVSDAPWRLSPLGEAVRALVTEAAAHDR